MSRAQTPSALAPRTSLGYLTPDQTSGVQKVVPPAPSTGDARFQADMTVFRKTRSLKDSPRWKLAQSDDNLSMPGLLHAFQCAIGLDLTPERVPKLVNVLSRANSDVGAASSTIKFRYGHKRPFQVAGGDVCLSPQGKLALLLSPDYPSGHAATGWETGMILAQLAPDSADDILARARAFGQSRVVCGVHNLSAVQAAWLTATAVFAMQESSAAFHTDLDAARSEIVALRASAAAKPQSCKVEAETLSQSPY